MCVRARVTSQMSARHQGVVHSKVVDQGKVKAVGEKDLEAKAKERDMVSMGEEKERECMDWRVQPSHGEGAVRHGGEARDRDLMGAMDLRNGLHHLIKRRRFGILGQVRDGTTMGTADSSRMDIIVMVDMIWVCHAYQCQQKARTTTTTTRTLIL